MNPTSVEKADRIAARFAAMPTTSVLGIAISQPNTGTMWSHGDINRQHFIASTTKLYTTAVIMQLRDEGAFNLDTRLIEVLGEEQVRGLNVHYGYDHGPAITLRDLLANTSGIPDYFEQKRPDGTTLSKNLLTGDVSWTFDEVIETARSMDSAFAPSTPGRAQYSDTNFQLLGRIIEVVTGSSYEKAICRRVIDLLSLSDTWLFTPDTQSRYTEVATMLKGRTPAHIPKAMSSTGPDGGIVSTAGDGLRFLSGFINGELFPARYLDEMMADWNPIFPPFEYGIGMMRFAPPWWYSPFAPMPPMIGHSGASGSVLFYMPERDLYVSGTVNQLVNRSLPYRLMLRLLVQFR